MRDNPGVNSGASRMLTRQAGPSFGLCEFLPPWCWVPFCLG